MTRRAAALGLFALVIAEVLAVAVGWAATGMSAAAAVDSFMVPNAVIGLCCGLCGGLIAGYRPDNRLGWLLLGAGVCQTATAAVTPWLFQALATGAPARGLATAYSAAWPWSVALFIPLALLSFPDGCGRRAAGAGRRRQRRAAGAAVQLRPRPARHGRRAGPRPSAGRVVPRAGWLRPAASTLASEVVLSATYLAALVVLVLRYRRGTEQVRGQLLWLLLATAVAVALVAVTRLGGSVEDNGFPVILFTVVALVPIAMTIAVLRHRLLDIRLLWSRALTYAVLTLAVAAVYLALVEVTGAAARARHVGAGHAAGRGGVQPGARAGAARGRPAALRRAAGPGARARRPCPPSSRGAPPTCSRPVRGAAPALRPAR